MVPRPYPEVIEDFDVLLLYSNDRISEVIYEEDLTFEMQSTQLQEWLDELEEDSTLQERGDFVDPLVNAISLKESSMSIYYFENVDLDKRTLDVVMESFVLENDYLYIFKHSELTVSFQDIKTLYERFLDFSKGFFLNNIEISTFESDVPEKIDYNAINMKLGNTPSDIAIDNTGEKILYIANEISNSVSVVDLQTHKVLEEIEVGERPTGIAFDTYTNRIYVTNSGSDSVSIIDGVTRKVINDIDLNSGDVPVDLVIDQLNSLVFVINEGSESVAVIKDTKVLRWVKVGAWPTQIAINPHVHKVYVTNNDDGSVSIIRYNPIYEPDLYSNSDALIGEIKTVKTGPDPVGIAIDPFNNYVYVANSNYSDEESKEGSISIIDGVGDYELDEKLVEKPMLIAFNKNTERIYFSTFYDNIYEYDVGYGNDVPTLSSITQIKNEAGFSVRDMVLDPSENRIYIINDGYPYSGLYEIIAEGTSMEYLVNVHYQVKIGNNDVPADLKDIILKCNGEKMNWLNNNINSGSYMKYKYGTPISCEVEDSFIFSGGKILMFDSFKNEKGVTISAVEATQNLEVTANFQSLPADILSIAGTAIASLAGIYKYVPVFRKKMQGIGKRIPGAKSAANKIMGRKQKDASS